MKFLVSLMLLLFILMPTVFADTFEFAVPVKKQDGAYTWTTSYTTDGQNSCYWKYYNGTLCGSWGTTFVRVDGKDGMENINFLSVDVYARFKGGPFWQRIGFGVGLFDRRTEEVNQSWDFHISWQLGVMWTKNLGVHLGIDHWSNGRSFAEKLNLDYYWPDTNDGGDRIAIGVTWEF